MANEAPLVSKPISLEVLKYIPRYDGTPYKLPNFISTLQDIYAVHCDETVRERDSNHWILFRAAMSHLDGPAEAVVLNNSADHLLDIIRILKKNFADNRTVPDLIAEITIMKSNNREHPIEFLNKLDEKRTNVITRYKLDGVHNPILTMLTEQLDATLVRTLLHGIHPTLGSHLQVLQPKNLEDARTKLINDCSIVLEQLRYNSTLDVINKNDTRRPQNIPHFKIPNYEPPKVPSKPYHNKPSNQKPHYNYYNQPMRQPNPWNPKPNFPQPNYQRNSYQPHHPNWFSQNTVSMKTQNSTPNFRNYKSPQEMTYIKEAPETEKMQTQLNQLTDAVSNITERFNHFLDLGRHPTKPPDSLS